MLVRQLEDEVVKAKTQASQTNPEVKAHMEALQVENDHLTREIAILRETAKVSLIGVDLWIFGSRREQLTSNHFPIEFQQFRVFIAGNQFYKL